MNKKISLIHSTNLAPVDYAYAGRIPSGMDLLFLAGACPINKDGEVPNLSDYELQGHFGRRCIYQSSCSISKSVRFGNCMGNNKKRVW